MSGCRNGLLARAKKELDDREAAAKKKKPKKRGKGGSEAERIVQAWLELAGWTTHRAAATGFHKFQKKDGGSGFAVKSHDLFGALDILAFRAKPLNMQGGFETVGVQVTTQTNRSARRAKVEQHKWPDSWLVWVAVVRSEPKTHGRGRDYFVAIESLCSGQWLPPAANKLDMQAIRAHWKAKAASRRAAQQKKQENPS